MRNFWLVDIWIGALWLVQFGRMWCMWLHRKEIDFYTHHKLCTRIHYAVNGNENMNLIHAKKDPNKIIYFYFCLFKRSWSSFFVKALIDLSFIIWSYNDHWLFMKIYIQSLDWWVGYEKKRFIKMSLKDERWVTEIYIDSPYSYYM